LPTAAGSVRLLVAAVAAGGAAALAQVAVRRLAPALVGVVVVAAPIGLAALAVLRLGVTPIAAAVVVGAIALVAGPLLPRAALWLSGLPRPVVPADAAALIEADDGPDLLPPAELAERAHLARGYLAGSVGGCAIVSAGTALPAATAAGWLGPAFALLTVVLLGLRARSFADPGPARALAASALAAGIGLALVLGSSGEPLARPIGAVGLLVAAGAMLSTIDRHRPVGSPVGRRAVDLAEGLLTAAVAPLALGVLDMYSLVRAL
jgi:type VII secretion integral membrane protein EccD